MFGLESTPAICDRCKQPLARWAAKCPGCGQPQSNLRPGRLLFYCLLILLCCAVFAGFLVLLFRADPYAGVLRIL